MNSKSSQTPLPSGGVGGGAFLLGFDVGSSSVKASLVDVETGQCAASAFYPESEAPIKAVEAGWAEQSPDDWWRYLTLVLRKVMAETGAKGDQVKAIGISYQMHGLVCVGRDQRPLRPAIIWCDSRAVPYGERAFRDLGSELCLGHLLNSPGNFTASKLAWVKENEPRVFEQIDKIMLPGDYIAMRLSGDAQTTVSGLSEGMLWDFSENRPAQFLMDYFGFPASLLPSVVPTFSVQSAVSRAAAEELGLKEGTPISYRAGDQPNNALSLNVFNPGEIAATAGTSGVVYGVLGDVRYDEKSRVNIFAHVNHQVSGCEVASLSGSEVKNVTSPQNLKTSKPQNLVRLGVLGICNGTGILNAWMRRTLFSSLAGDGREGASYAQMNELAEQAPVGSDGVSILPFGNGAERILENRELGCSIHGLNFNKHSRAHLVRAAQEGIVFALYYGMEVMRDMGMDITKIHAGQANMFLSPLFRQTLSTLSGATIELLETDGAVGAAKGAGIGCGIYKDHHEAFASLKRLTVVEPREADRAACQQAYERWKRHLAATI